MKRYLKRPGFALVVTLMISVVVAMMLGATLALSPGRLNRAGNSTDQARAEGAIEAGVEYCRARLQEDPLWKGNLNRVVVNSPTLYIEEQSGMVVGLLRSDPGEPWAQFRIRFNFYNGSPILGNILDDGLGDPPAALRFNLRRVSVNNLAGGLRFLPEPNGSNVVTDLLAGLIQVPPSTAFVTVQGLGGAGLRDTGPGNYEPPAGSRGVVRRTADVVLGPEYKDGAPDAAMMGGGSLNFTLPPGEGTINVEAKGTTPRARTKGSVLVNSGGGGSPNYKSKGELLFGSFGTENVSEDSSTSLGTEGGAPFYELEWNDIHKASTDPAESVQIPGGTYVFDDSGALHYYDMAWDDYKTHVANLAATGQPPDPGTVLDANMANIRTDTMSASAVILKPSKLTFSEDVLVNPSGTGVTDFTLVPQRGTQSSSTNTSDLTATGGSKYQKDFQLLLTPGSSGKTAFTTSGDTLIATQIKSDKGGSFVTEGDLRIDAGKLDKYGNVGVSFYSKHDISVSTYDPQSNKYTSVGVDGLFYAWNDFSIQTGEPALPEDNWGNITLVGSLVAYGTTTGPSTQPPGTGGAGLLSITARDATFKWDAKKLGDLLDISKFGSLTSLKRYSYIRH